VPADERSLARAREIFAADVDRFDTRFAAFLAEGTDGQQRLVGCAAIRRRMSESFESRGWRIMNRVLVLPELRRAGLGRDLLFAFCRLSQSFAGGEPAFGFFLATRAEAIGRILDQGVARGLGVVVPLGVKRLPDYEVAVRMSLHDGVAHWLESTLAAARSSSPPPPALEPLLELIRRAWRQGLEAPECAELGRRFASGGDRLLRLARRQPAYELCWDFAASAREWGLLEAAPGAAQASAAPADSERVEPPRSSSS
jgi:GNAT superfamily N-acetyltransferase